MRSILFYLSHCFIPLNHVFFCLAYQLPLRKRAHGKLRLLLCFVIGLLFLPLWTGISKLSAYGNATALTGVSYSANVFIYLLVQMVTMLLLFWFDCDISLSDAIYGTACAYTTQHLSDTIIMLLFPWRAFSGASDSVSAAFSLHFSDISAFFISLVVLLCGYFLIARPLPENGQYQADTTYSWGSALVVLGFVLIPSYYAKILLPVSGTAMFRVCMLFDLLCCVFMLWVQVERQQEKKLIREVQVERIIRDRQKEQFTIARDSVERINRKCHELKHQVAAIRSLPNAEEQKKGLAELEKAVVFYDYFAKSGNEVIDTVLTEKGLLCEQAGITWTCMANGPTLDFMEASDLYLLFDSALENSIESVRKLTDQKHRIIALTLHRKRDMAFLQIENYFEGTLVFDHGLPASTKPSDGLHGYGLKNIRSIVQKYHGTMDITTENRLFLLSILLPLPEKKGT